MCSCLHSQQEASAGSWLPNASLSVSQNIGNDSFCIYIKNVLVSKLKWSFMEMQYKKNMFLEVTNKLCVLKLN